MKTPDWFGISFIQNCHVLMACQRLENIGGNRKQAKVASAALTRIESLLKRCTEQGSELAVHAAGRAFSLTTVVMAEARERAKVTFFDEIGLFC